MTWSRIDDAFAWHPKVQRAGNAAVGCWVRCLAQCSANGTDGFVPLGVARGIGSPKEIAAVTAAGLWRPVRVGEVLTVTGRRDTGRRRLPDVSITAPADGFWIADYLHYHRSRGEVSKSGDDGSSDRADERASAHANARADLRQRCARPPIPTHPNPTQPTNHPSTHSPPSPGGRQVGGWVGGDSPQEPEGDGADPDDVETPPELVELFAVVSIAGYRLRLPKRHRLQRASDLQAQGLTAHAARALWAHAQSQGRKPMALFATWLDSGQWRDVILDLDLEAKEAAIRARAPKVDSDDVGRIYGEPRAIADLTTREKP